MDRKEQSDAISRQWVLDRLEELRVAAATIPSDGSVEDAILDLMDRVAGAVSPRAKAPPPGDYGEQLVAKGGVIDPAIEKRIMGGD